MDKTSLGDRHKGYEKAYSQRIPAGFPICVRIDGRSFSKFTKGFDRPYDERMSTAMSYATKQLVMESHAVVGYTQSDEISLIFHTDNYESQVFFDGKTQKLASVLASLATVNFYSWLKEWYPEMLGSKLPSFDCRVWAVPSKEEAVNYLIWRNRDAVKNSISMLSSEHFSPKELHGKTQNDRLDMLHDIGINWNECPAYFKEGIFVASRNELQTLSEYELQAIPKKHQPEGGIVTRSKVIDIMRGTKFAKVSNKVDVIFNKSDVKVFSDE